MCMHTDTHSHAHTHTTEKRTSLSVKVEIDLKCITCVSSTEYLRWGPEQLSALLVCFFKEKEKVYSWVGREERMIWEE